MAKWICKECYDAIGKEVECFTDANWLEKMCEVCGKTTGKYNVCDERHLTMLAPDQAGGACTRIGGCLKINLNDPEASCLCDPRR